MNLPKKGWPPVSAATLWTGGSAEEPLCLKCFSGPRCSLSFNSTPLPTLRNYGDDPPQVFSPPTSFPALTYRGWALVVHSMHRTSRYQHVQPRAWHWGPLPRRLLKYVCSRHHSRHLPAFQTPSVHKTLSSKDQCCCPSVPFFSAATKLHWYSLPRHIYSNQTSLGTRYLPRRLTIEIERGRSNLQVQLYPARL